MRAITFSSAPFLRHDSWISGTVSFDGALGMRLRALRPGGVEFGGLKSAFGAARVGVEKALEPLEIVA